MNDLFHNVLQAAPHAPGVYLMQDRRSQILYVGKAKDLFKRLSSYAHHSGSQHNKTTAMLSRVTRIDTILTHTEKEALILEASLIKKHKPKYNIILRDDKSYPYIKVTVDEEWPRVTMSRRKARDKARYFGPYSSASAMWATLKLIANTFPLRKCKGQELRERNRPCLNHQIGRCLAPCAGKADPQLYQENVRKVLLILEGRSSELLDRLQQEMHQAAEELDFEQAAKLRDQLTALNKTLEKQLVSARHGRDQDVFGWARQETAVGVAVLYVRDGAVNGSRTFFLPDPYGDDEAILSQIISQIYDHGATFPHELLLPFGFSDQELLQDYFSEMAGSKVQILVPQRGEKLSLVDLARANARQILEEQEKKEQGWQSLQQLLTAKLHLTRPPRRIECLDISNTSGKLAVGSLVAFCDGEKETKNFRHYRIRLNDEPNDYAMMREVLQRRLAKGIERDNLPDLFMVDGGKGQLGIALAVAKELGLEHELEWVGIAKERDDEGEKLFRPGRKNPIILPAHNPALLYLMRIRDESHRFGVTFHRRLRNQSTLTSVLDEIPGIGSSKKKALLKHLGSLKRISQASSVELQEVPGVGPSLADIIYQHFHK